MRHGLLVALIALAFAPSAWAAEVRVEPAGGTPVTLSLEELEPSWDVRERPYTLRGADGEQTIVVTGVSLDRLLDRAGVDPFGFAGATVSVDGRSVPLAREQTTDPAAFPEGRPVFWVDEQGGHFLRPVTGAGDLNADDRLTGGTITIALAAAGGLHVSATASRRRVEAGDRVTFTARVEGAAAGEDVRVRWTFDDGATGMGTRVRHRFRRPGTYAVVVGVTSPANPTGASAIVRIRVGEPEEAPDREGGGSDDDAAPDSGAAAGATGGDDGGVAGSSAENESSDGAAAGAERRAARRRAAQRRSARRRAEARRSARARRSRGDEVTGVLLDDPGSLPPVAVQAAARTGTPDNEVVAEGLPPETLYGLAALAMLAAGAWRERRPVL